MGRAEQARAALDPFLHVICRRVEPPQGFADLASFNAQLLADISANPDLHRSGKQAFKKPESIGGRTEPALQALLAACRAAIDSYVGELREVDALDILPAIPSPGRLAPQANVVQRDQPHGAHVHKYAAVSGIYYVAVPSGKGGALLLGALDGLLDEYTPAWPRRRIRPEPGTMVLFLTPHLPRR